MMLFIPELFHHEKITNPQVPTFDSYKKTKHIEYQGNV